MDQEFPEQPMNDFMATPKSSVKLIKNTKGINIEIKLVAGEEDILKMLKDKALEVFRELEKDLQ